MSGHVSKKTPFITLTNNGKYFQQYSAVENPMGKLTTRKTSRETWVSFIFLFDELRTRTHTTVVISMLKSSETQHERIKYTHLSSNCTKRGARLIIVREVMKLIIIITGDIESVPSIGSKSNGEVTHRTEHPSATTAHVKFN